MIIAFNIWKTFIRAIKAIRIGKNSFVVNNKILHNLLRIASFLLRITSFCYFDSNFELSVLRDYFKRKSV